MERDRERDIERREVEREGWRQRQRDRERNEMLWTQWLKRQARNQGLTGFIQIFHVNGV